MMAFRLARSALAPVGVGAATMAMTSMVAEHTSSKACSRITQKATETVLARRLVSLPQRAYFSTGTTEKVAATAATARTGSTATTASTAGRMSFMEWYEGHLNASPVKTKMITGGFLWGIGDAVAQVVPQMASKSEDSRYEYDVPRTTRAVVFGFFIHAPISHVHYNFLEWLTVRWGVTGIRIPIFKAFMEQFVYWSWFSNSLYHGAMGAMQGMNATQIYHRIADVLWETQKAQWAFWVPVQLVNFRYVPVRHQLNVVLVTSIVWTALLSAWYPPQKKENEKAEDEKN